MIDAGIEKEGGKAKETIDTKDVVCYYQLLDLLPEDNDRLRFEIMDNDELTAGYGIHPIVKKLRDEYTGNLQKLEALAGGDNNPAAQMIHRFMSVQPFNPMRAYRLRHILSS